LILPISFFLAKKRKWDAVPIVIATYALLCFCFLLQFEEIAKGQEKYYQTSYTFFEYSVFAFIFWTNLSHKKVRKLIIVVSFLFFAFQVFYLLTTNIRKLDTIPIGIETILMLIYISFFFYEFSKISNSYIYNHYCFWIAVGVLIYLGGSFFFYIFIENLTKEQVIAFGNLTFVAEIIKNLCFAIAIFLYSPTHTNANNKLKSVPFLDMI
jgi:hypothetical protein